MAGLHLTVFAATVSHAFSCPNGAFSVLRHNDVRDLIAKLMSEVCYNVQVEPHLQPLSGKSLHYKSAVHEADARVDIRAAGFWNCRATIVPFLMLECLMLSLRATSLLVSSNFSKIRGRKRRAYEECIREVERGSFTPLVFSSSGAMGKAAVQ